MLLVSLLLANTYQLNREADECQIQHELQVQVGKLAEHCTILKTMSQCDDSLKRKHDKLYCGKNEIKYTESKACTTYLKTIGSTGEIDQVLKDISHEHRVEEISGSDVAVLIDPSTPCVLKRELGENDKLIASEKPKRFSLKHALSKWVVKPVKKGLFWLIYPVALLLDMIAMGVVMGLVTIAMAIEQRKKERGNE